MKILRLLGLRRTREYNDLNRIAERLAMCIVSAGKDRAEKQWFIHGTPAVGFDKAGTPQARQAYIRLHWRKCLTKDELYALDTYNTLNDGKRYYEKLA